jgi:hypothetical protein
MPKKKENAAKESAPTKKLTDEQKATNQRLKDVRATLAKLRKLHVKPSKAKCAAKAKKK